MCPRVFANELLLVKKKNLASRKKFAKEICRKKEAADQNA